MTGKSVRYGNSSFFYHLINWCTYLTYRFLKLFTKQKQAGWNPDPLLITGLFRSGTTITARIVKDLGYSAGPEDHLLKAMGSRKELNPDGFLENHFCMELSMYIFHKTDSWGDSPPGKLKIESLKFKEEEEDNEMVAFSMMKIHDDRISNINKLKTQLKGSASKPNLYFDHNFRERSFVKNPHIAVLFPYFKKLFPSSRLLVVFRNPFDAVNSAKKVSPLVNYDLYNAYYEELISEFRSGNGNIIFFSYDDLIKDKERSIKHLATTLNIPTSNDQTFIKTKEIQGLSKLNEVPRPTREIYEFMLSNCINK